jgi:hypothetical protein
MRPGPNGRSFHEQHQSDDEAEDDQRNQGSPQGLNDEARLDRRSRICAWNKIARLLLRANAERQDREQDHEPNREEEDNRERYR